MQSPATDPRDPVRSCFGIASALVAASYLLTAVHGVDAHHELVGLSALVGASSAVLMNLCVSLADAARGRVRSLYLGLGPVFALVLVYDGVNEAFGGAGGLAAVAWLALGLLVGVEAWLLWTLRRGAQQPT